MGHQPPRDEHHKGDGEGHSRPHTPGTPTFLRPAVAPIGPGELDHESRAVAQRGRVEFNLPSPISPSRPRSPWGCFDPYFAEVKHAGMMRVLDVHCGFLS